MVKIKLTKKARIDLQEIEGYIALDNPIRAFSFVEEMMQSFISTVGEHPLSSPLYNRQKNVRRFVYQAYNIYYHYDSNNNVATVLHVLNAATLRNVTLKDI